MPCACDKASSRLLKLSTSRSLTTTFHPPPEPPLSTRSHPILPHIPCLILHLETSMVPLPLLLLAAAWFAPAFAWLHDETLATGPLLDDPSDWAQSKLTDTGLTFELSKPTDTGLTQGEQFGTPIQSKSTEAGLAGRGNPTETPDIGSSGHAGRVHPDPDSTCIITKKKVNTKSGPSSWAYADDDGSMQMCDRFCTINSAAVSEHKISNYNCLKADDTPYYDEEGVEWSGS
jgi:hypothetical protein